MQTDSSLMPMDDGTTSKQTATLVDMHSEIFSTDIINANNQFAIDFYNNVSRQNNSDNNIFFSPWSISSVFAITYEGARENTADEIQQVFMLPTDTHQRQIGYKTINDDLNHKDAKYNLAIANSLWIDQNFEPFEHYVDTAKTYYDSKVSNVNLRTGDGFKMINKWVEQKTQGKIKEIFPDDPDPLAVSVLVNAIYFKGNWLTQFDEKYTQDEDFWQNDTVSIKSPMMRFPDATEFKYAETTELQILELPYEGRKASMIVLLPHDKGSTEMQSIENTLTVEKLKVWKGMLQKQKALVQIPKFKMETSYDLKPLLRELGIREAFLQKANFTGITDESIFIKDALHKAFVDVNEEGTEAAAVTAVKSSLTGGGPTYPVFRADHPFIFFIQDNFTDNILFMGKINNPSQ